MPNFYLVQYKFDISVLVTSFLVLSTTNTGHSNRLSALIFFLFEK